MLVTKPRVTLLPLPPHLRSSTQTQSASKTERNRKQRQRKRARDLAFTTKIINKADPNDPSIPHRNTTQEKKDLKRAVRLRKSARKDWDSGQEVKRRYKDAGGKDIDLVIENDRVLPAEPNKRKAYKEFTKPRTTIERVYSSDSSEDDEKDTRCSKRRVLKSGRILEDTRGPDFGDLLRSRQLFRSAYDKVGTASAIRERVHRKKTGNVRDVRPILQQLESVVLRKKQ